MFDTGAGAAFQEIARAAGIVTVIFQWILYGFRHNGVCCKMQYGIDLVLRKEVCDQVSVPGVTNNQLGTYNGIAEAGG